MTPEVNEVNKEEKNWKEVMETLWKSQDFPEETKENPGQTEEFSSRDYETLGLLKSENCTNKDDAIKEMQTVLKEALETKAKQANELDPNGEKMEILLENFKMECLSKDTPKEIWKEFCDFYEILQGKISQENGESIKNNETFIKQTIENITTEEFRKLDFREQKLLLLYSVAIDIPQKKGEETAKIISGIHTQEHEIAMIEKIEAENILADGNLDIVSWALERDYC